MTRGLESSVNDLLRIAAQRTNASLCQLRCNSPTISALMMRFSGQLFLESLVGFVGRSQDNDYKAAVQKMRSRASSVDYSLLTPRQGIQCHSVHLS